MRASLNFTLPEESPEFEAAIQGGESRSLLWNIDNHCRSVLKYTDPPEEVARLASEIRSLIRESGVCIE